MAMQSMLEDPGPDETPEAAAKKAREKKIQELSEKLEELKAAAGYHPAKTKGPAEPPSGNRKAIFLVGIINLALLAVIIGFQVKIVVWQTAISSSLKRLEEEVNTEKLQRVALGNDLLRKIEDATSPSTASGNFVTTQPAIIYSQPSVTSKIVASLKKGQEITGGPESGGWQQITTNGKSGWVNKKFLKKSNP
jgi:hypothetical protein